MEFWRAIFWVVGIVGIVFGVIIVAANLFYIFFTWADGRDNDYVYMKFKQWRKLYDLNPEKWCADDDNPYRRIYIDGHNKNIYVRFSFFGTARYMVWQSQAERRKKQVRSNAELQLLLRAAQTDIERLKAQADREIEAAKRQTEETKTRISMTTTYTTSGGSELSAHSISPISEKINHATDLWF